MDEIYYGISQGKPAEEIQVGSSSTPESDVEVRINVKMERAEVLSMLKVLQFKILSGDWPPVFND